MAESRDEQAGIILQFERPGNLTDEDIEERTLRFHEQLRSLAGYRAAVYYNVNLRSFGAVISFDSAATARAALDTVRRAVQAAAPGLEFQLALGEVAFAHLHPRLDARA
jgi:hypothetical protein